RISLNPKDVVSWYRILLLHEGVGPKTAERILDEIATGNLSLNRDPHSDSKTKLNDKIFRLLEILYSLHTKTGTPTEKAQQVIDYYLPIFKDKYDDFNKRKKDLDIFLNITEKYHSMENLLSDMAIEPPIDSVVDLEETTKEDEFVTLSTIHSAKGLEWHSVFVIHAIDGFFPSYRSMDKLENLEEERRLMYVAVTRAKQNLFISYPMNIYDRESGTTLSKPSRFLANVTEELAEGWLLEE
ncbi:MAG: ATP-dependent helicase, partial [Ignavibacteria bacterium]|nr:ATP-dependent helicase [Ignavibacteria bacterium]